MPVLSNPRHEKFCQELAKGKSASEAYKLAGYETQGNAAEASASRLLRNAKVRARLSELQERAAERAEITVARLTQDLLRIARKAEGLAEAPGLSVARGAVMDIAKLNGLVVEKTENVNINHDISDEPLSDDEWVERHTTPH